MKRTGDNTFSDCFHPYSLTKTDSFLPVWALMYNNIHFKIIIYEESIYTSCPYGKRILGIG